MFERRLPALAPIVGGLVLAITTTMVLRADSFTPIAKMHVARSGHQATLLDDGRVLVTGGSDDSGAAISRAEVFNPVTRSWAVAEPNVYARVEHAATLLQDGRVVVVGGASTASSCEPISAAEIYESRTGTWSLTPRCSDRVCSWTGSRATRRQSTPCFRGRNAVRLYLAFDRHLRSSVERMVADLVDECGAPIPHRSSHGRWAGAGHGRGADSGW